MSMMMSHLSNVNFLNFASFKENISVPRKPKILIGRLSESYKQSLRSVQVLYCIQIFQIEPELLKNNPIVFFLSKKKNEI